MNERLTDLHNQAIIFSGKNGGLRISSHIPNDYIEKFAELIRADEREACAKVCDDEASTWTGWPQAKAALTVGAIAIRARGNT